MIGKKVIVRSYKAGVFFGTLTEKNGAEVILKNARKLWSWDGAAAVEELALNGTQKPDSCKFTVFVDEVCVLDVAQIIKCTNVANKSIEKVKAWSIK